MLNTSQKSWVIPKTFGHKVCQLISALFPAWGNTPESVVPLRTAFLYLECGIAADLSLLHQRDAVHYFCEHVRDSVWRGKVPLGKQLSSGCTVPDCGAALGQSGLFWAWSRWEKCLISGNRGRECCGAAWAHGVTWPTEMKCTQLINPFAAFVASKLMDPKMFWGPISVLGSLRYI